MSSWSGEGASNASRMPSDVRDSVERGWREVAAIDEALERGQIDEKGWHAAVAEIVVPAYLGAGTPWEQSGKSGDLASWERGRRPVMAAVDRDGTFLDVGCANGFLLEHVMAPGGRLIVGVFNEEKEERRTEESLSSWGFEVAGRFDAEHRDPRV